MDVCVLLDEVMTEEEDVAGLELLAVDCGPHDAAVTVTVTVDIGQLLQSTASGCAKGAAAAAPSREARKILEYILSKDSRVFDKKC